MRFADEDPEGAAIFSKFKLLLACYRLLRDFLLARMFSMVVHSPSSTKSLCMCDAQTCDGPGEWNDAQIKYVRK
uniref:Secreted protein n=1 Tax=Ascaris lumbricoides TaxID=6252 RepID=A0A0M3I012_ASCLU